MSKSLQRGILFSICVALVLALSLTLVFFAGGGDKNLTAPQGQVSATAQNTTSYTHGSNIGRPNQTSGTPVGTAEALIEALATNGTYYLTNNIDLNSSQIFIKSNTFRGTLYGNGHTITLTGKAHSTSNVVSEMYRVDNIGSNNAGALISKMQGGKVYDLNIQASGDFKVIGRSDDRNTNVNVGLLAGWITGGSVIDNVSVTLAANSFVMAMGYGTPSNDSHTWHAAGLIGGVVDNNNTITNITATVNGIIDAGTHNSNDQLVHEFGGSIVSSSKYTGVSGAVVGKVEASTTNVKIDNIIVAGSGQMRGACVGLVAFTSSNVRNSTATVNIFNKTTSNVVRGQHYWSYTFLKWDSGSSWTVNNYYRRTGAQSDMNAGYNPQNTINVPDTQNVYFDPAPTDYANSLAVVFTGRNKPASGKEYEYTISGSSGVVSDATFTTDDSGTTRTVVARNLPTAIVTWGGNNGTFNATLNETEVDLFNDYRADLKFYEHGYTATQSNDGMPISSGDDWLSHFGQNASGGGDSRSPLTGNYYLTKDIVISGFSGKFFNGTFDGNGHTIYITGVSQDSYGNAGIGGVIGTLMRDGTIGGTIKNMRVVLVNELTVNGPSNGRVGGVVGHIQGGTLENVTVLYDDTAALISETTSNDITIGGVAGRATSGAQIKNVTLEMESGSRLAPSSGWTYLAGVVGIIDAANGATFENIVMRGTGNFNAHSDNADEPPYYAAIANTKAENYNGSGQYASIDGLIYDFDAQLNGTFNGNYGDGQDHCSMYYFFSNNWNGGSGSVGSYHNLVSYNNIFIAEGKGGNLAENVGDRFSSSSGNAPIMIESDTTPYTIASGVTAAAGRYDDASVTAYFQPVDVTIGSDYNYAVGDLVLKVSRHNWQEDESLMVNVGGDTGKVISYLEDPNEPTSDRIVKLTKDQAVMAATNNSNTVQVSDFLHVAQPQLANELTYTGSGIDVTFVVRYESESGSAQMGEELPNTAYTVSIKKKEGGTGSVVDGKPVNAGEYVATITLTNGDTFLVSGTGGDSTTATVEFSVKPFTVQGTWELSGLTLTYGDPVPSDIDQYINITLTSQNIPGGLDADAVTVEGFTTNYTQGTAAGTTVNVTAVTFVVGDSLTASNYDFTGITGSGSLEVQKKELSITLPATEEDPYIPHISAVYGATGDKTAVQGLLTQKIIEDYVTGIYNDEVVSFTIDKIYIAATDEESGEFTLAGAEEVADENIASLDANSYLITVTANSSNYTVAEGQFFVYGVSPATLTVTGVTFEGDFDGVYDGQAHGVEVQFSGLIGDDTYNFIITITDGENQIVDGNIVTNAGTYTVTATADSENTNYGDVTYENGAGDSMNEYAVTISPITLMISDKSGVYTELTAADIVIADMVSGILEGDTEGVTVTPAWDTPLADEDGWLAANTYNATLSLSGDKSANYTFGSDNIATVTVDQFDLRGAHITITSEQFTYDGTEKTVEYTVLIAEGGKDITSMLTPAGNKQTNAGDAYTLTLTGGNNFTNQATATWSIGKAKLSVTAPTAITFMDKAASELSGYLATGKWITGFFGSDGYALAWTNDPEDSAVPIGDVAYAAAGTYTATVQLTGENADTNYELSASTLSVTVNELDIGSAEVTWKESDLTYDAAKQSVSLASVTVNGVALPVEWFNLTDNTGTDADTYTATVAASNANITGSVNKDFTIAPFAVTVKWEAAGEISVGTAMPENATDMSALDLTARVTEFNAPGITDAAQYSIVVTASGFDAGHIFTTGEKVKLTPSMTFGQGAKENNYVVTFDPETIEKAATAISVVVYPANETVSVTYGDSVKSADGFISAVYFNIRSGAEGSALTSDNFTVTVTDENGAAVFGMHGLDAGTYTVTIEGKGAYSVSNENNFFTYTVAPLTLTAGTWSGVDGLTYNGNAAAPVFTLKGVLNGDNVTVGYTIVGEKATGGQAINAGDYTVTAKLEGDDAGNYTLDGIVNVKTFTIAPKALTVLGGTAEFDFDDIGETTNTYKDQIASWDSAKDKVITGFVGSDTYTLGDIYTADMQQEVVYTDGKLNAGSYYVVYTVGDNYTIDGGDTGLIALTVNKLSYEISLTYTIDGGVQSGWDGNISFKHDAPITLTFASNALEITFNDGSEHKYVVTVNDETLPNVTFTLGGITINKSNPTATISSVQSMDVDAKITPDDETNHEFTGTTSFNFTVKRDTRVEANEEYFSSLGIPSEYTGSSISVGTISASATDAFTVTLGGVVQSGAEVSIAAILDGEPTENICDAGDYVITATYTTENDEIVTGTYEFTVAQAKLSFTLGSAPAIVYGDMSADVMPEALKAFTATGVNNMKVEGKFAITVGLNENIYSSADYVKAGSYDFTITFTPGDNNYAELVYDSSADNNVKLTVEKKTITPFAISYGEVTSVDKTLTLTYAGKDAYANNLDIAPNGKFEYDDVEFIDDGDYSDANEDGYTPQIRIYESGDGGNYKLDLSGWKVVVLKKTIEVTVTPDSDTYTGSAITLTATSEEVVKGDDVTFTVGGGNGDGQTVTNAGTYVLTVTLGGEQGGNYEVAGELSVTIGKASVDLVWTNEEDLKSVVYNGQPYEAEVDVRFNGQSVDSASIKYTSDEVTVTDGKAVNAGSYTATATFAGTDNFNASSEYYGFTIAKMVVYGEWEVDDTIALTYDGTSKAGYATWTWTTAPLNEGDVTVGYKYKLNGAIVDDVIDAGNYNVYAVFTDNTGNYDTESGILQGDRFDELTVARRAVTVEWSENVSFTYNGAEQAPAATALNVAEGDSLTLTVTGAKKDVGTYTATVAAASVTGNYVLEEDATVKFTIAPKSIGVEWGDTAFTYNGSAQVPTATATDLVDGDSLTLTVTGAQMNAGSYEATVKAASVTGNYKLESDSKRTFTIKKADLTVLTVTPDSLEIRERETEDMQAFAEGEDLVKAFADRISVSGVSGKVSYTVTIAGENNYDDDGLLTVGEHTFTIDAGDNYNAASVSVTVIATPVVTVIASVEGELVYNGSAFEISYALKEGAPEDVSMDDITVTASVETIVNAGEYEVNFTVTGSNEDYDYVVQDASGNAALTFTIARRGLDVAEVAEAVYGNLQVSGTLVTGTHSAFVAYNDEEIELIVNVKTAALSRAAAEYLDAGEYEVTIALANEQGNFSLNGATLNAETEKMEVESTLDVAPKTVTVGYTPSSPVYDAKGISVTLDKFEGMLIEGDDPAVNIYINDALYTGGKVVLDAGTYTVRYESADPNYAFAPKSATFTVAQKQVTPNFDLNTGSGSLQITGGGKLEIEEGEETDIVAAIDNFMQSSGVSEEEMSIAVSGDLKLEDMATWAPGTYTVTVTLSGNHSGSMQFTVEVSEKIELPPPVEPELPETPVEAGSGNDWVLPLVIAIVALIDLALLVAIGVAAKKRA